MDAVSVYFTPAPQCRSTHLFSDVTNLCTVLGHRMDNLLGKNSKLIG
jgi:hypothetical protein